MNYMPLLISALLALAIPLRADHDETVPGAPKQSKTRLLEAGAELLQRDGPLNSIHATVCGFHFYNGEPNRQVTAHHYCAHVTDEVMQCVIYDTNKPNARLIGIEYIISGTLFDGLPSEEKKLWHSHQYEVKSGELVALGLPVVAEKELMKKLVNTYGKTWHLWQIDRGDALPLGAPQLMMVATQDGQTNQTMLQKRDRDYNVSTVKKRGERADITAGSPAAGADAWTKGDVLQSNLQRVNTR